MVAGALAAAAIPSGTEVQIRLTSPLNTASSKSGQRFEAVVIAPVAVGERIVLAQGIQVVGHIVSVQASDQSDQQASLSLAFDRISDGVRTVAIAAKVAGVDNARESVDATGQIVGIKASETGSA